METLDRDTLAELFRRLDYTAAYNFCISQSESKICQTNDFWVFLIKTEFGVDARWIDARHEYFDIKKIQEGRYTTFDILRCLPHGIDDIWAIVRESYSEEHFENITYDSILGLKITSVRVHGDHLSFIGNDFKHYMMLMNPRLQYLIK